MSRFDKTIKKEYTQEEIQKYREEAKEFVKKMELPLALQGQKEGTIEKFDKMTDEEIIVELNKRANIDQLHKYVKEIKQYGVHQNWLSKVVDVEMEEMKTGSIDEVLMALEATLVRYKGFSLAASQIGLNKNCIVVPQQGWQGVKFLINPKVVSVSDKTWTIKEGSLNFLGIELPERTRPRSFELEYYSPDGSYHCEEFGLEMPELTDEEFAQKFNAKDLDLAEHWEIFTARAVLHAMEYNEGKTPVDNMGFLKKDMIKRRIKKLYKRAEQKVKSMGY